MVRGGASLMDSCYDLYHDFISTLFHKDGVMFVVGGGGCDIAFYTVIWCFTDTLIPNMPLL